MTLRPRHPPEASLVFSKTAMSSNSGNRGQTSLREGRRVSGYEGTEGRIISLCQDTSWKKNQNDQVKTICFKIRTVHFLRLMVKNRLVQHSGMIYVIIQANNRKQNRLILSYSFQLSEDELKHFRKNESIHFFGLQFMSTLTQRGTKKSCLSEKILLVFLAEEEMIFPLKKHKKKMLDKEKWKDTYKVTSHLLFIQLLFFADAKMRLRLTLKGMIFFFRRELCDLNEMLWITRSQMNMGTLFSS